MTMWRCFSPPLPFLRTDPSKWPTPPWVDNGRHCPSHLLIFTSFLEMPDFMGQHYLVPSPMEQNCLHIFWQENELKLPWRQSRTGRFALSNSFLTPWCPEFRRKVHCQQWTRLVKMVSNLGFFFFPPGWVHTFHRRFYPLVKRRHDINPLTTSHMEL